MAQPEWDLAHLESGGGRGTRGYDESFIRVGDPLLVTNIFHAPGPEPGTWPCSVNIR